MATARDEIEQILASAEDLARGAHHERGSVHVLLALFLAPCTARDLLIEVGADHRTLLGHLRQLEERRDPAGTLDDVLHQAAALAERSGAPSVDSTALLASLLRVRSSAAAELLRRSGVDVTALRARVIGALTLGLERGGTRPRHHGMLGRSSASRPQLAPAPPGFDLPTARALPVDQGLQPVSREPRRPRPPTWPPLDPVLGTTRPRLVIGGRDGALGPAALRSRTAAVVVADDIDDGVDLRDRTEVRDVVRYHDRLDAGGDGGADDAADDAADDDASRGVVGRGRPLAPTALAASGHLRPYELDPLTYPTLCRLGRNITRAALDGECMPLIGRDALVDAVIDVLLMRQVNNPCLVGEAGVGKTALVEGLAARLAAEPGRYGKLGEATIVEVPVSALLAGTSLRGAFAERMALLRDEVARAEGRVIIFIDEIHTLMGAGAGDGPLDAANDLKTALARGRFPLIGATTRAEYRRFVEADPAMERRLQVIEVPEPTAEEALAILTGVAPGFADYHGLPYGHDAIVAAVELSLRFLPDRALPDKAIAVLDRAGAQARRRGRAQVSREDVASSVAVLGGVALERLLSDAQGRLRDLAAVMAQRIFGQDAALERIARRIARNQVHDGRDRPMASLALVGPPGVGKTEAAAALAHGLFLAKDALVRFDMADYAEAQSVSRLIGSPPGYVGHQQPGQLSEALHRRPYRVVLFDDLDRAAPEVIALVQQLVESGRLVDNQGRSVDVRNAVVVVTTTLPAELFGLGRAGIGFVSGPAVVGGDSERVQAAGAKRLGRELTARLDEIIALQPLTVDALTAIAALQLLELQQRLVRERMIRVDIDAGLARQLAEGGAGQEEGARWLRRRLAKEVEEPLGEAIVDGRLRGGMRVRLQPGPDGLVVRELEGRAVAHATAPTHVETRERP